MLRSKPPYLKMLATFSWESKTNKSPGWFALLTLLFYSFSLSLTPTHTHTRTHTLTSLDWCNGDSSCLVWHVEWLHVILPLNGYRLSPRSVMAAGSCCHEQAPLRVPPVCKWRCCSVLPAGTSSLLRPELLSFFHVYSLLLLMSSQRLFNGIIRFSWRPFESILPECLVRYGTIKWFSRRVGYFQVKNTDAIISNQSVINSCFTFYLIRFFNPQNKKIKKLSKHYILTQWP